MRRSLPAPLLCLALLAASEARADELADEVDADESIYAVQPRPLHRVHEFSASLGVLPLDALYKGITLGVGYTYHFNALVAWQIAHFRYAFNVDTGTVQELTPRFDVVAARPPPVEYLLDSSIALKLLSGKSVLGQRRVVGAEVALLVGPAVAVLSSQQVVFGLNAGLGLRAHLNRWFTANLEVREYELFQFRPSFGVTHVLDVSIGASLNLR